MIVRETTHHGSFRHTRDVTLPDVFSEADVEAMLATSAYAYRDVAPERLTRATTDLRNTGRAEHGWTRWEAQA